MSSNPSKPPPSDLKARIAALARIAPIHQLPRRERGRLGACIVKGGGRPKTIKVAHADDYNAEVERQRDEWVQADAIVTTQSDPKVEAVSRLRAIERGLAEESASLLWDRRRVERVGGDGSQIASRRIDALCKLALTVLGRVKFYEPEIDPKRLERITQLWIQMIKEAAENIPQEHAGPFIDRIERAMTAWLQGALDHR